MALLWRFLGLSAARLCFGKDFASTFEMVGKEIAGGLDSLDRDEVAGTGGFIAVNSTFFLRRARFEACKPTDC